MEEKHVTLIDDKPLGSKKFDYASYSFSRNFDIRIEVAELREILENQ